MKPANLDDLKDKIFRPDFDKHLIPLMLYRGSRSIGRMSRLFNFAITMMESEVETYGEAVKLAHNPDYAHLCGPRRPLQSYVFPSLFGRLIENPRVTDNIPGLTRYVRDIRGMKFKLARVSIYTNVSSAAHNARFAPWRIPGFSPEVLAERERHKAEKQATAEARRIAKAQEKFAAKLARAPREPLFYPYLIHKPKDGNEEAALVVAVNNAVPKHLPEDIRADICQDLLVAILTGEISRYALHGSVKEFTRKVQKMHPLKYGDISLDQLAFEDSDADRHGSITPVDYQRLEW